MLKKEWTRSEKNVPPNGRAVSHLLAQMNCTTFSYLRFEEESCDDISAESCQYGEVEKPCGGHHGSILALA